MAYLIGIDVGTTGAKAILMDLRGKLLASSLQEYPLHTPHPQWAEQDPHDWWHATIDSIKDVLRESKVNSAEVKCIGLSGQMHGLVLLDEKHEVLRPAILWCDGRTTQQCHQITTALGQEFVADTLCNSPLEGFTAPKLLWVRQHEPDVFERIHKLLLPKDYVRYQLTGELATDVSDASGTLLFDIRERRWSEPVMNALELPMDLLPDSRESVDVCGVVTSAASEATGLAVGTPVVAGGADNTCSAIGNGIVKSGRVSASIGTSGVVLTHTDEVKVDPELRAHTFCHSVPGKWYVMGVVLSAGGSFRWFRDALADAEVAEAKSRGVDAYELLTAQATEAPVGSEGLLFLPYLSGERTPHGDANAKGVYFGLSLRHSKAHVIRATMEGITYAMRDSLEILRSLDLPLGRIHATGGGAQSSLWRQMQADVYGTEVVTVNVAEGPAFGAAILAGVGSGVFDSIQVAIDALVKVTSTTEPNPKSVARYEEYYQIFRSLYPALKPQFDAVSSLITKATD